MAPNTDEFQFHKGTIRTVVDLSLNAFDNYFNSIKVQLEPDTSGVQQVPDIFQFHKGTIRTATSENCSLENFPISIP